MTGPQFLHIRLKPSLISAGNWRMILSVLFFFTLFISASWTAVLAENDFCSQSTRDTSESQQTQRFQQATYLTTRREAIVTYLKALQAPEGYFHGWLAAPPPFEPDGTLPDFTVAQDAYETLKNINCTSAVDWTNTREFISGLIHEGLLNLSKNTGVSTGTCQDALTFIPEIGLGALIDVDANVEYVLNLQQTDGGFLFDDTSSKPTLVGTYFALDTLRLADRLYLADIQKAKEFLYSCHSEDEGWYSNIVGDSEDISVAAAGIMIADMLGVLDDASRNRTAEYLLENWNPAKGADTLEDLSITEHIAWSLALLNRKELIDSTKMAQWVLSLQKHMNGAFVGYPEADLGQERLVMAKSATHLLYLYNETYRLDEDFSVVSEPVWEIPQWWLDYISREWGTTTTNRPGPGYFFYLPDLSFVIASLPFLALAVVLSMPAVWVVNKKRMERVRRRELKRERKNLRRSV